jgi:trehalose 6-phosphate synthase
LHPRTTLDSNALSAARDDHQGVHALRPEAGASHERRDALIVNPYDRDQAARSLAASIDMPVLQQRFRMRRLRRAVASFDAGAWATRLLADVTHEPQTPVRPMVQYSTATLVEAPVS